MNFLTGKRTYIIVAVGVVVYGAEAMGLLEKGTADKLEGLLAILGLGTLRAGLAAATKG